ncbi:ExeA family protein [Thalassotalea sp. PS06]|uniref:ExeA family protein n=1 Tax=Thalassotalea sp. PS06 TaxID=2594005 RepID=UPI001162715F|nr:AAA family ATPase [Thalassotalea sp. PS06]QDO99963.1 AAA family ATPase [Thalassotalea sp. PS06]
MYENFYGFKAKPFQLNPDPKFFFGSAKHTQALSYLQYGLEQGEGFIVITGPIGTGKTMLAQSLLHRIKDSSIEAIQIVTSKLSPEDLLRAIVRKFKMPVENRSKASLLQAIEQHLLALNSKGKRALLLVDEAQNLPAETVEEMRMLSNFQRNNKPLLQSFLLGQEELKPIIQSQGMEQFRQRIIASCHLQPLTTEEIAQYIKHRLELVSEEPLQIFADDCYEYIKQKTLGIPRKINLFVDRVLLYGFLNNKRFLIREDLQAVSEEFAEELSTSQPTQADINAEEQVETTAKKAEKPKGLSKDTRLVDKRILKSLKKISDYLQESIDQKMSISRDLDKLIEQKVALAMERQHSRPEVIKKTIDPSTEQAVIDYAISHPDDGQYKASEALRQDGVFVSGSAIRSIWLKHNLENYSKRVKALEEKVNNEDIVLNEEQLTILEKHMDDDNRPTA